MSLLKDMEVLLKSSLTDRRTLRDLERVRRAVKDADDVVLPEDGRFYDDFHERIMNAVDDATIGATRRTAFEDLAADKQGFAAMWTALTRRWQELE